MDKDKKWQEIFESDDLGLLNVKPKTSSVQNADERLITSFEEINSFYEQHNREPEKSIDVQERTLAARLEGIISNPDKVEKLKSFDRFNLLPAEVAVKKEIKSLDDVLADDDLGLLNDDVEDIFVLKNVPKKTTMPEYVASRKVCEDFEKYEHLFTSCQRDITSGERELLPFSNEQQIAKGYFFVLKGVLLYVADVGKRENKKGKFNARLHCIFENGTESDMLLRSLAAELYKDGRRVTEPVKKLMENFGEIEDEDKSTGFIYVVRSLSSDANVQQIRNLYKIGFSRVPIEERIKNAENDPTYLMAPVKIVTGFECYNFNPQKLEQLLHTFFGRSCLNFDIFDKKGNRHTPREWFIAPLDIIEQAIYFLLNGEITKYRYDGEKQEIVGR